MKKVFLLLTLAVLMFGAACKPLETPPVTDAQEAMLTPDTESKSPEEDVQEPEPVEPVVAEPVEQVTIDYAKNLTIEYREGYKLLTVTTPWAGAEQSFSYALVPEEFAGMLDVGNAMLIKTPIKSIVTFSTTYYPS